jgi:hypothetical protein
MAAFCFFTSEVGDGLSGASAVAVVAPFSLEAAADAASDGSDLRLPSLSRFIDRVERVLGEVMAGSLIISWGICGICWGEKKQSFVSMINAQTWHGCTDRIIN